MNPTHTPAPHSVDLRWLRWSLAAIAFLLAVIAVELSALIGPQGSQAFAQIPDSGAQRQQLIEGQKQINRTLEQILDHLRTGEIKVKLIDTDKDRRGQPPALRGGQPSAPQRRGGAAKPR